MTARYLLRPKASQDLDDQALYLAQQVNTELGHRFLAAAHETFNLLASRPQIGWPARLKHPSLTGLRIFRVSGFSQMLVFYRPTVDAVDIVRVVHGSRNLLALIRREGVE